MYNSEISISILKMWRRLRAPFAQKVVDFFAMHVAELASFLIRIFNSV